MLFRSTRVLGTLLAATLVGCSSDPKGLDQAGPSTFLLLNKQEAVVEPGDTDQLTATKNGAAATGVTWTSSNTSVATVSNTGLVTALSSGFTAVTATLGGEQRSAGITVPVLQGTALTEGQGLVIANAGARFSTTLYRVFVPAGSTNLTVTLTGGTGDADFYIRRATPPTVSAGGSTCASFEIGNDESCSINNPAKGPWYILVETWDPYAGATLLANVTP